MKRIAIMILVLTLSGCASVNIKPPTQHDFTKSKTFTKTYDETWIRAVDWFADHNVTIDKIEKSSGLLTAKYDLAVDSKYLDCGDIKPSPGLSNPTLKRLGNLNVTVRKINQTETKVNVNFFGDWVLTAYNGWSESYVRFNGNCVSTGTLEENVLSYIANH